MNRKQSLDGVGRCWRTEEEMEMEKEMEKEMEEEEEERDGRRVRIDRLLFVFSFANGVMKNNIKSFRINSISKPFFQILELDISGDFHLECLLKTINGILRCAHHMTASPNDIL